MADRSTNGPTIARWSNPDGSPLSARQRTVYPRRKVWLDDELELDTATTQRVCRIQKMFFIPDRKNHSMRSGWNGLDQALACGMDSLCQLRAARKILSNNDVVIKWTRRVLTVVYLTGSLDPIVCAGLIAALANINVVGRCS